MLIFIFLGLLALVGTSFVAYGCVNLVRLEKTLSSVKKNRELSKINTLERIRATCEKLLRHDTTDNHTTLRELQEIHSYIKRYF